MISSLTERDVAQVLEEGGLEENSGSYDDYRDGRNLLQVDTMSSNGYKNIIIGIIKKYFNII